MPANREDSQTKLTRLEQERESVATALWNAKPETTEHAQLENQFNEIEKNLFVLKGGSESDYQRKRDVRHRFHFELLRNEHTGEITGQLGTMAKRADGTEYTMLAPEQVINWRNTKIGGAADDKNRSAKNRNKLKNQPRGSTSRRTAMPSSSGLGAG